MSILRFLNCLCGSEHEEAEHLRDLEFLNCLCGSEHVTTPAAQTIVISKLPMRQ